MADAPDNIVLQYLRRIDAKVDRLGEDLQDIKVRMTAVEEALAGVNRRIDRVELRVERIERRLDLVANSGRRSKSASTNMRPTRIAIRSKTTASRRE